MCIRHAATSDDRQGIRANAVQLALQLLTVFAVGLTAGSERNVVPVLGRDVLGVESVLVIGTFVVTFGFVKAALNLFSGRWGDAGRKRVLIAGWVVALPIPVIIVSAPNWWWISAANVLLGINQAMTFSMTVNAAIDLAGRDARALAVGAVESVGYAGVAVGAWVTGVLGEAYGLRPAPFYFLAAVVVAALLVSVVLVRETLPLARGEDGRRASDPDGAPGEAPDAGGGERSPEDARSPTDLRSLVARATWGDRTLLAACQAGHVEKFVDALVWIAFPLYLTGAGLGVAAVGAVVLAYNGTWAVLQVPAGRLADARGRRLPIVAGMFLAGGGVLATLLVSGYVPWLATAAVTGAGIGLLYPNLQVVFGDAAHPAWRASGIGVYRMWRDAGYGVGAVLVGLVADLFSVEAAFATVALAMFASGALAFRWLAETHPDDGYEPPAAARAADAGTGTD